MKHLYLLLILACSNLLFSQYQSKSFTYQDSLRKYLVYVPNVYDGSTPVPLVLTLHGLGDNMNNFKGVAFDKIADTANFIVVVPQALVDYALTGSTAWNSGAGAFGITLNPNIDDVGFLNALIDTISTNYNIDQERVYSTGFSMGGFMTNRLAVELSHRFAAVASVAGTKGTAITGSPTRKIPFAHFHGTADQTVSYSANNFGMNAEDLVKLWVNHNKVDTTPIIDSLPNIKNDNRSIVKFSYLWGEYDTEVLFYKIIGGGHDWLNAASNDISFTKEIWDFFSRHTFTQQTSSVKDVKGIDNLKVYPNPIKNTFTVETGDGAFQAAVYDYTGKKVFEGNGSKELQVNTTNWQRGIYLVNITQSGISKAVRVVVAE